MNIKYVSTAIFIMVLLSGCTSQTPDATNQESTQINDSNEGLTQENETFDNATVPESAGESLLQNITENETIINSNIEPNLILHYTFDDEITQGTVNNAMYFDGTEKIEVDITNLNLEISEGTIAFWFNFESILETQTVMPILYLGSDDGSDNMFIIEIGHSGGSHGAGSSSDPDPSNTKMYTTWIKNNMLPFLCFDTNINLEENRWYHMAVVISENGNTGYLDGVKLINRNYNFGDSNDIAFFAEIPVKEKMYLGYGRSSYMISPEMVYYKGYLDEFRIYNKTLSDEEISSLSKN